MPTADGDEGTADALHAALAGERVQVSVHGPLGLPLRGSLTLLGDGQMAAVETATASGLGLLPPGDRDPEGASTQGTGELIAAAAAQARRILVGVGGSATTGGALGASRRSPIRVGSATPERPGNGCSGVRAPEGSGPGYGSPALRVRMERFAEALPRDPRGVPMSGAGGGPAGGLWGRYGGRAVAGAPLVLQIVDFDARVRRADVVITGEGRLDGTTIAGKAVSEVVRRSAALGVPAHAIVAINATTPADRRELVLASIREARTLKSIKEAASALAGELVAG